MTVNVGSLDRIIRLIAAICLIALPFVVGFASPLWTTLSVVAGVVMLGVAATRVCPIYSIFGFRTCRA